MKARLLAGISSALANYLLRQSTFGCKASSKLGLVPVGSPPNRTWCFPRPSDTVDENSTPTGTGLPVGGLDMGRPAFVFQTGTGDLERDDSTSLRSSPPVDGQVIEIGGC